MVKEVQVEGRASIAVEQDVIDDETRADDVDESKHVMLYLRCDEGTGDSLSDLTDNQFKVSLSSDQAWSEHKLEEREPLEYEDKWGNVSQPNFSVDLAKLTGLEAPNMLGQLISQNSTIEFWCKQSGFSPLTVLDKFVLDFSSRKIRCLEVECSFEEQFEHKVEVGQWTHVGLVFSSTRGFKLFLNANLVCKHEGLKPKHGPKYSGKLIHLPKGSKHKIEITEVRIWNVALNLNIISETFRFPLAMLFE